jgi:hypothetical protein
MGFVPPRLKAFNYVEGFFFYVERSATSGCMANGGQAKLLSTFLDTDAAGTACTRLNAAVPAP